MKGARAIGSVLLALWAWIQPCAAAQTPSLLSAHYNPAIPTVEAVLGHASGEAITTPEQTLLWFKALERAAPDRVLVTPYATSWEGRQLVLAVIASPKNLSRLPSIKANMARLASGLASASERQRLIADTPAVVWLGYGVHGDEISSTDAAIALSYHVLAASDDADVDRIRDNTVLIIDPLQNPDGRNRFINSFEAARGLSPSGDPSSAEHDQPWPGGRYNHYLFDMNRDWFALTQPETQGRVRAFLAFRPVVLVDAHEMSGEATYFFPPVAQPINPNVAPEELELQTLIGRNNAKVFDARGFDYFNRETYDLFYPGFGDSWPSLNGAVAFTYEAGGPSGLIYDRANGSSFSYRDAVLRHLVASLSTAAAVAKNRDRFSASYSAYRAHQIAKGRADPNRFYVLDLGLRRSQAFDLGQRLALQDIAVTQAPPGAKLCGKTYPDGALIVDSAQPNFALLHTLLASTTPLDPGFLKRQEQRRAAGLSHELYDVTAWSLPLMAGVARSTCADARTGGPLTPRARAAIDANAATYGFAVPWNDAGQARLVFAALAAGFTGRSLDQAFTFHGRTFPRGSVIFAASHNPPSMRTRLSELAVSIGAELAPMDSSWVDDGVNYGGPEAHDLTPPRIALAWDAGVEPTSAGATRFVLEQRFGLPVTPLRTGTLSSADLARYQVLILPEGRDYADAIGDAGKQALAGFVDNGGVLIGLGSAVRYLADPKIGLSNLRRERAFIDPAIEQVGKDDDKDKSGTVPGARLAGRAAVEAAEKGRKAALDPLPGALVRAEADPRHWLSAGYEAAVVLASGSDIYAPLARDQGTTAMRFAPAADLLAGGQMWNENRLQTALKPFVTAEKRGKGWVLCFTQSPTTRAYLDGLDLLVANAVLLGPAHAR